MNLQLFCCNKRTISPKLMLKSRIEGSMRLLSILLLSIFTWAFFALPSEAALTTSGKEFQTQSLDTVIVANEDNSYNVTEKWVINYYQPMHGIFRTIAEKGAFKFIKDGKPYTIDLGIGIQDIHVDGAKFDILTKGDTKIIRIGDANTMVTGLKEYTITYKMILPPDKTPDFDFLYLELKPKNWQTNIDHFHVKLILPKKVPQGQVSTYSGVNSNQGNTLLKTTFDEGPDGTMVYEATGNNLPVGSVATVFMFLPEGYFVMSEAFKTNMMIIYGAALLLLIVPALLWFFVGRDPKVTSPIEFYPPNNLTPMQMQHKLSNTFDANHIMAEIMYLAGKGYLTLEPVWKNSHVDSNSQPDDFIIKKVKDLPKEASEHDKILVNVFANKDNKSLSEIGDELDEAVYDIKIDSIGTEGKAFSRMSLLWQVIMAIGVLLLVGGAITAATSMTSNFEYDYMALIPIGFSLITGIGNSRRVDRMTGKSKGLLTSCISIVLLLIASYFIYSDFMAVFENLFMTIFFIVSIFVAVLFVTLMHRPLEAGLVLKGRIWGFKDFLEKTETDRIKALFNEDSKYFYTILPYAFLFGLSDKWIPLMAEYIKEKPDWLVGDYMPNQYFINRALFTGLQNSFTESLPSFKPESIGEGISTDNFGGFSGGSSGGFGGGGVGGGGGGGW